MVVRRSAPELPTLRPRAPTRGPFSLVGAKRHHAGDDAARANVGDRRKNRSREGASTGSSAR
jgi:hypothetical protein